MAKKILIIIILALLTAGGILLYLNMNDQKRILDEEAAKIKNMDINKDQVDMTLHTKGDYMAVEDGMKCYIYEYLHQLKSFEGIVKDKKLLSMLSIENLKKDGPYFTDSLKYIQELKEKLNTIEYDLVKMGKRDTIMKSIEALGISDFQIEIFESEMIDNIGLGFFYPESELDKANNNMLAVICSIEDVVKFLSENGENWYIDGQTIKFKDNDLYEEYKSLVSRI